MNQYKLSLFLLLTGCLLSLVSCQISGMTEPRPRLLSTVIESSTPAITETLTIDSATPLSSATIHPFTIIAPYPTLGFIPAGKIVYESLKVGHALSIMDGEGKDMPLQIRIPSGKSSTPYMQVGHARWSRDGKYLAFGCSDYPISVDINVCILDTRYLQRNDGAPILAYLKKIKTLSIADRYIWLSNISWSPDGKYILANIDDHDANSKLCVITVETAATDCGPSNYIVNGLPTELFKKMNYIFAMSWSPVDNKLVFPSNDDNNLQVMDLSQETTTSVFSPLYKDPRLRLNPLLGLKRSAPVWSSDGKRIVFIFYDRQGSVIGMVNSDGTEFKRLLDEKTILSYFPNTFSAGIQFQVSSWSPDGRYILFTAGQVMSAYSQYFIDTQGIFRLDLETDDVVALRLGARGEGYFSPDWGP